MEEVAALGVLAPHELCTLKILVCINEEKSNPYNLYPNLKSKFLLAILHSICPISAESSL